MKEKSVGLGDAVISFLIKISWINAANVVSAKAVKVHSVILIRQHIRHRDTEVRKESAISENGGTPISELSVRILVLLWSFLCVSAPLGQTLGAGLRVVGQRSLISQDRARSNQSRTADVTAASDDRISHLRRCADARVTPNHGILDARALFNVTA